MQKIDYEELAKREVIKAIKRFRKRFILEMDLLSGEEKQKIVEEIEKIIERLEAKPYTAYTLYGDILHESDEIAQMLKEIIEED